MNSNLKLIPGILLDLLARLRRSGLAQMYAAADPPLRSELFSADQMERHGKALAGAHALGAQRAPDRLLPRLAENEGVLIGACKLLTSAVKANRRITPAGEWLLDNFYLIEEQIRIANRHLPKGYSRELPHLLAGSSAGLPRVYDIALEAISHGDGRVDPENLVRFVAAYQKVTALRLGELWAIPIMLRLALLENLRRVGARIATGMIDRNHADSWADQMMEVAEKDPKSLILVTADMARSDPPMVDSFVAELARRLQGQSPALALPLTWIEQRLSESGLTIEQLVQSETQSQAANQVSVSNSIASLRFLGAMDWREFVETMSVVEQKLQEDPDGVYGRMDFATRDRYRHVVEKIAKSGRLSESEVARKAIQLAHKGKARAIHDGNHDARVAHVGFYLIDKGLPQLESAAQAKLSAPQLLQRMGRRFPLLLYLGAIALMTAVFTWGLLAEARAYEPNGWMRALICVVSLLCTSHLAVALANWLASLLAPPHLLPRMDYSAGIPRQFRTLVVVPTMLASVQGIEALIEALEVRFLANQDENLRFGLLTDYRDAHEETLAEDRALLLRARKGIEELNEKYKGTGDDSRGDNFFLFHRPRRWNPSEGIWMGYERKRGKLAELNALLRGIPPDRFFHVVGETAALSNVKFVITLDTDTQLPRDAARQLVATMAHPLNRARYDAGRQRVCDGYGILQPRVAVSLPSAYRSIYARLCASEPGIDPYTRSVSDVYQDLFGEGSFIGKGIYDVDAFELSLGNRFPENRILSHDLLEGCYARSGLLSDVQLYEEYPRRYSADVSRRHRWIRGDWQIAQWALARVPDNSAGGRRNPLSALSQWKIFDNLRRSLVPAGLTLMLLLAWTVLSPAWFWTFSVFGIILIPPFGASILEMFQKPDDVLPGPHLAAVSRSAGRNAAQAVFMLATLPYEAFYSLDAIVRTAVRKLITRRRLLEWTASSEVERDNGRGAGAGLADFLAACRSMWISPLIASAATIYLAASRPAALAAAAPILCLWFAAPAIAWWVSRPLERRSAKLTAGQVIFLQKISRKTWAFFDTFVGAEDHWLPPDNFQEHPAGAVAHRTSPTNMGLALLANLSAYDFGYIPAGQLIERTANALQTMQALERHRGHFYNWYDTQSLKPLTPLYISSVDSGNLAGHLLTLRPGLLALADRRILGARIFEGLSDTLGILVDVAGEAATPRLARLQKDLESAYDSRPVTIAAATRWLEQLTASAAEVSRSFDSGPGAGSSIGSDGTPWNDAKWWASALVRQCQAALDELTFLAPFHAHWLTLLSAPASASKLLRELTDIGAIPTLRELARLEAELSSAMHPPPDTDSASAGAEWLDELLRLFAQASQRARDRIAAIERLALQAGELANMEYDFLYDKTRHLLAVGYNVDERRLDSSHYDLLASEARLSCFVAIAQGKLPQESWFALGRLLTTTGSEPILMSWSGSMFEYLMPLLVMPIYENTLLDQTCRAAVARQIAYGNQRGVAWGISECGYNAVDANLNYQYRAFGVPGLGLKRGLAGDLVIAPYASALALMVAPEQASANLQRLAAEGLEGKYGFYEAIDYTPSRLPRGQSSAVIRSFMAHHQGMSLIALGYLLLDRPMQTRFESDPLFQATTLLLHERIPKPTSFHLPTNELAGTRELPSAADMPVRMFNSPDTLIPEVQLLSNGRYHVMVTNAGGGYSRWKDLAVTRWREDATCDNWGSFCYIRDVASGAFWSTAHQPTLKQSAAYQAIFSDARAEFRRRDHDYDTHTEIVVSPEDDIELRRLLITNRARARRTIDITTYAEVVLAPPAADALHPAFGNLFVQTEIMRERHAILCTRRPRSLAEHSPWMFHLVTAHGADIGEISYETDRMRFIGRGRSIASPDAMGDSAALSGSQGSVLDPIVAIRYRITLDPQQSATIDMVSGIGETRAAALSLVEKYQDRRLADRVFELAWTHSQVALRQINATEADAQLYGRLASSIIFANASLRADPGILIKNRRGQSGLWGYAISGDLPIVLLQIGDMAHIDLVRQLVQAHAYWRLKGLAVDMVIWNEDHAGYRQLLQEQITGLIAAGFEASLIDRPGGIFLRVAEQISSEDRILFQTVARAIITDTRGALVDQVKRRNSKDTREASVSRFVPTRAHRAEVPAAAGSGATGPRPDLQFFNGIGGFAADGREYLIYTAPGQETPAPWANVLANPHFGSVISESGLAYTWGENAQSLRLTPWHNDPVCDSSGEALYLRDEESGQFWSPAPLPCRGAAPYVTRHGFGYSVFEHSEDGIASELCVFVALDASIKFSVLKLRNASGRPRRLSATGYVEWVLGELRPKSTMHVVTDIEMSSGALYARNPYNIDFGDRIAFFDVDDATRSLTGDRTEFLGRNGILGSPAAMTRTRLSGRVGAGMDPCGAIQVPFELADGQEREIVFRLGLGRNAADAGNLVRRFRGSTAAHGALDAVREYWKHTLGAVRVETPDASLNVLTNGWLVYQTLACRLWARSGYYQSGGAYGFRDQLQDVMALIHTEPRLVREHLLRCAAHQFREGDVQHWWQPSSGRGVRTHCSDDFLWLPLATCRYVLATGDTGVLDETVRFLEGRQVGAEEDSYYDLPGRSEEAATLYEHCVRAIMRGLGVGAHGLPLMGSGDWNDGMNLVGAHGKGESVWLGFFSYEVLMRFSELARMHGDAAFAERCQAEAAQMRQHIELNAWDGAWYRRAYFDDGSPLGSASNDECRIDSISQSWSVLSGAGDARRSRSAMEAVDTHLVRREHALVQLLDPPFDKSAMNPGYIKGYVPGVRENGGQYTHAAIWTAMAFAAVGDSARAWELFGMINPIRHSDSAEAIATYKVEPYVIAADVYALPPHTGRGGWTWYTGSAGWMYRLILESLLGLRIEADRLHFIPCLPADWEAVKVHYRYWDTVYHIAVLQTPGGNREMTLSVDGVVQSDRVIVLVDDLQEHSVEVRIGRPAS